MVLNVVSYHYIRNFPETQFPKIKGCSIDEFIRQLRIFQQRFEMATLESAIDFLKGAYTPVNDLCLLTFDDGLREHFETVTPILADHGIQGIFFLITGCLDNKIVAPVHMNHFLTAGVDFKVYRQEFFDLLHTECPGLDLAVNDELVGRTYRWDDLEMGKFKFILNFVVHGEIKNKILNSLFERHFGDIKNFSHQLYLQWDEAIRMQENGMAIGGHSHCHQALATLSRDEQLSDLTTCIDLIRKNLKPQKQFPYGHPYGKDNSFNIDTLNILKDLGFACAFTTTKGSNHPSHDLYTIQRYDTNDFKELIS